MPDKNDRISHVESKSWTGKIFFTQLAYLFFAAILTLILVFALVPLNSIENTKEEFVDYIAEFFGGARPNEQRYLRRLKRSLDPEIAKSSSNLVEHLCNSPEVHSLLSGLEDANQFQPISSIGRAYLARCDQDVLVGYRVIRAEFWLTRFDAALEIADRFSEQIESSAEFSSWRGFILEKLDRHLEAAVDFERSLYLFGDIAEVSGGQFFYVSHALAAGGKPCAAIRPLQLYVSLDPANRNTSETRRLISNLRGKGNCLTDVVSEVKAITLKSHGGVYKVAAEINGVGGNFILDTGASMVMLSREFADRAEVAISSELQVETVGITGSRIDFASQAAEVSVSGNIAHGVSVIVASVANSFSDDIDGLLGQTYLGRFKMKLEGDQLVLTGR